MCGEADPVKNGPDRLCLTDASSLISFNTQNQITNDNKIRVILGSSCKEKLRWKLQTKLRHCVGMNGIHIEKNIQHAWIKYREIIAKISATFDLAILRSDENFYNDGNNFISAICLAALDADITQEEITTVGRGQRYSEYPIRDLTDASQARTIDTETSCTTNQYGPKEHRFKSCDIKFLEDNNWKCKKIKQSFFVDPKEYPRSYDHLKCNAYFNSASMLMNPYVEPLVLFQENFDPEILEKPSPLQKESMLVKYIEVKSKGIWTSCYREDLFENNGWCKTENHVTDHEWGFCDTACELVSVIINQIYIYVKKCL